MKDRFEEQLEEVALNNTAIGTSNVNGEVCQCEDVVSSDHEIRSAGQIMQPSAIHNEHTSKNKWKNSTCSHIFMLVIFTVINFNIGAIVSIQAHLYPTEVSKVSLPLQRHN